METLISTVLEKSLSVGILLAVVWFQRQDKQQLLDVVNKFSDSRQELKQFISDRIADNKQTTGENNMLLKQILQVLERQQK